MARNRPSSRPTPRARSGSRPKPSGSAATGFNVAPIKGTLKTVTAVTATMQAQRVVAKKRIHPRRLTPRVPTGKWQADPTPTAALALRQASDRSRDVSGPLADTDTIAFTHNVQLNDVATADPRPTSASRVWR